MIRAFKRLTGTFSQPFYNPHNYINLQTQIQTTLPMSEPASQNSNIEHQKQQQMQKLVEFRQSVQKKGVCYLSRIPPYMTPNHLRKMLSEFEVERVFLMPEDSSIRSHRKRTGGNKKMKYTEGWVEFADKKMAKRVAEGLNCQKMVQKKGSFYSDDLWNLKYLPKFKWQNLTAKLAYDQRIKRQRLKMELKQDTRNQQFYDQKAEQGKVINRVIRSKKIKGKKITQVSNRNFKQQELLPEDDF